MSKNLIRNYTIVQKEETPVAMGSKIPRIITNASVNEKNIEISTNNSSVTPKETKYNVEKTPTIEINKNKDGVVTSIDVVCICGEKITIKLEY
ncbi:MAG: hypothetical protein PHR06_13700 [Candidatus Cloacimonetes bacterium]|nr:hypothetical protein [Candidatus Cloacimonadota bacterium]